MTDMVLSVPSPMHSPGLTGRRNPKSLLHGRARTSGNTLEHCRTGTSNRGQRTNPAASVWAVRPALADAVSAAASATTCARRTRR